MKFTKLFFLSLCTLLYLTECTNELPNIPNDYSKIPLNEFQNNNTNKTFATILAKAINNDEIKQFIKKESLKKVDKDYDVIYHLIKNKKINNSLTFKDALAQYCTNSHYLDSLTNNDPTLTISIPYINSSINAKVWDIHQKPLVVYKSSTLAPDNKYLEQIDDLGNVSNIERFIKPNNITIVVKSNERLSKQKPISTKSQLIGISNENGIFAYFIDKEYNNLNIQTKGRDIISNKPNTYTPMFLPRNDKNLYAFFNNIEKQRNYIYYNINPNKGILEGDYDFNYAEYLTHIKMNDINSYEQIADKFDPRGDWSDGNLEIYIDILLNQKDGGSLTIRKVTNIPIEDLYIARDGVYNGTYTYRFDNPLELFSWDGNLYGESYKITITEYDDGTEITNTDEVSTTFTSEYKTSTEQGDGKHKVTNTTGQTNTHVVKNTFSTKTTNNSDELGEFMVYFHEKIYANKITFTQRHTYYNFTSSQENEFWSTVTPLISEPFTLFEGFSYHDTGTCLVAVMPLKK